jgi:hypothetical protein
VVNLPQIIRSLLCVLLSFCHLKNQLLCAVISLVVSSTLIGAFTSLQSQSTFPVLNINHMNLHARNQTDSIQIHLIDASCADQR